MRRKLAVEFVLTAVGALLFVAVIKIAGQERILNTFRNVSAIYIIPFLLVTFIFYAAATYRWKVVLDGENAKLPFWTLLKYRLVAFGVNYLTPSARLGGEPLKLLLLKKHGVDASKSFASVIIDNFIGIGVDAIIGGIILITLFSVSRIFPEQQRNLFLMIGLAAFAVVIFCYLILIREKSVFSYLIELVGRITGSSKSRLFILLRQKISRAEFYMRQLLMKRRREFFVSMAFASLSWPLTILQYKFALLMLGVDASLVQIFFSILILNLTVMLPIPGALGVQEAGQFSTFGFLSANPYAGIALSLVIRVKDAMLLLLSWILLSREGISICSVINKSIIGAFRCKKA